MKPQNPTTWITAVLLGMTFTASGAFATEYETSLSHRSPYNSSWTDIIYVSTDPFVDYPESTSFSLGGASFTLDGLSTCTGGELRVDLVMQMWGGNINNGRVGWLSSEWGKNNSVTDLVFSSISNPGAGGQIQVSLDMDLFISWSHSGTSGNPACGVPPGEVRSVSAKSQFGGTTTEAGFSAPVPQGGQSIIGTSATVDLDVSQVWYTWLIIQSDVYTSNNCGDQYSRTECQATLLLGALNPDGTIGPVFNLPSGYTADADSIDLVDNYFQPAPPPCAAGDFDCDGDFDLTDHAALVDCMNGPDTLPTPTPPATAAACLDAFDFDADNDVDLLNYDGFSLLVSG